MNDTATHLYACELDDTRALRVDIYRLLAGLLRAAPDRDLLDWLASLEIDDPSSSLAPHWQALAGAANDTDVETLKRAHFRHLVGVIQGEVVPYASWYLNGELMDMALVNLRRDLTALGIERSDATRDPEDHLAALCEVMALLIEARSADDARFFMTHIAPWATRFLDDLASVDTPFYSRLGRLGRAFIDKEEALSANQAAHEPVRLVEP
ncbi:TorD/DmsD family molecular chaperone [Halomonas urumqiensis]|uniref:Molecular chaperone TorD n=1 Tax=Halomonas urumqiensis TaxID=1684789 RepID=A0A2N7UEN7_9GAMM|nr:molecular chaperone TorD family protein [Halomonas urumqiensis]PMR78893.1 molecular chaperone TorD [Halomonas urumqiensis]PTB04200.1 molecular chaperone TorD [Halomonas urumqiensis]GHE19526.1 TorD family cytoplasmic chaperone [Halomonas urumqiensis]